MREIMSIIISNLTYVHPGREELFSGISFSVAAGEKASLTGDNGTGKSTILRILAGELVPASGQYSVTGRLWSVPQHFGQFDRLTVAEALGVSEKLEAIEAIGRGEADECLFAAVGDDWDAERTARAALDSWGLEHIPLSRSMAAMSGGEKTRVFLAGITLHRPDVILMDEPTNHLDGESRSRLYSLVARSNATILVVSHDRTLLNIPGTTFELSGRGVERYGGNYDFYKEARDIRQDALKRQIEEKGKELRAAEKKAREVAERKERADARAPAQQRQKRTLPGKIDKMKAQAEQTAAKLKEGHAGKIATINEETRMLKERLASVNRMKLSFDDAALHSGKMLVEATDINFSYPGRPELWEEPFSFVIRSGERIALGGGNGTGKTTLLGIILGRLKPTSGTIRRSGYTHVYIDQEYSMIDDALTVYAQLERYNGRSLPEHFLKTELHRFLFPTATWGKPCAALSGGEKMRLALCCLEVSDDTPDMFVLDEPTNNLDMRSMEILTGTVASYKGTVLAVSHDTVFRKEIGVERTIEL